jgi:hypothetical protein
MAGGLLTAAACLLSAEAPRIRDSGVRMTTTSRFSVADSHERHGARLAQPPGLKCPASRALVRILRNTCRMRWNGRCELPGGQGRLQGLGAPAHAKVRRRSPSEKFPDARGTLASSPISPSRTESTARCAIFVRTQTFQMRAARHQTRTRYSSPLVEIFAFGGIKGPLGRALMAACAGHHP